MNIACIDSFIFLFWMVEKSAHLPVGVPNQYNVVTILHNEAHPSLYLLYDSILGDRSFSIGSFHVITK
jgi:hypothetical protein